MTNESGPADYLLKIEQMRQDLEQRVSAILGCKAKVEISVHSYQAQDTHHIAHDACLIEHQVWHYGHSAGVRIGKEKKFHVYITPKAVQR